MRLDVQRLAVGERDARAVRRDGERQRGARLGDDIDAGPVAIVKRRSSVGARGLAEAGACHRPHEDLVGRHRDGRPGPSGGAT